MCIYTVVTVDEFLDEVEILGREAVSRIIYDTLGKQGYIFWPFPPPPGGGKNSCQN